MAFRGSVVKFIVLALLVVCAVYAVQGSAAAAGKSRRACILRIRVSAQEDLAA